MDTLNVIQNDTTHPLLLLLSSLKTSLSNFQHEAHSSAVKLQHHSLHASRALERSHALEHENSVLNAELALLRNSAPTASSSSPEDPKSQINQLTLSLRTLNEKLTSTESLLANRTAELTSTLSELQKSKVATDAAYELSARIRGREESLKSRERELELKIQLGEERARMSERALEEYASLVRSLEGRAGENSVGNGHAIHLPATAGDDEEEEEEVRRRLLQDFAREREHLQIQLSSTQHDLALLTSQRSAHLKSSEMTLSELAELRMKLQLLERDDTTAAKMVSRYMKFSQTQTNTLQSSLQSLTARHSATLSSLTSHINTLTHSLNTLQTHNTRLLQALDDLGGEVLREGFGRRRETRLRIKLVGREERVLEGLRRWLRRAEEGLVRCSVGGGNDVIGGRGEGKEEGILKEMIQDAKILIDSLDNPLPIPHQADEASRSLPLTTPVSGSLARFITIQSAIDDLVDDAQREEARRIEVERFIVRQEVEGFGAVTGDGLKEVDEPSKEHSGASLVNHTPQTGRRAPTSIPQPELPHIPIETNQSEVPPPTQPVPPTPTVKITPSSPAQLDPEPHDETVAVLPLEPMSSSVSHGVNVVQDSSSPVPNEVDEIPTVRVNMAEVEEEEVQVHVDQVADADLVQEVKEDASTSVFHDTGIGASALAPNTPGNSSVDSSSPPQEPGCVEDEKDRVDRAAAAPVDLGVQDTRNEDGNDIVTVGSGANITAPISEIPKPPMPSLAQRPSLSLSPPPFSSSSTLLPVPIPTLNEPSPTQAPHPLLHELTKARNRYSEIQRSFHACHIALESLKSSLPPTTSSSTPRYPSSSSSTSTSTSTSSTLILPIDVLSAIVQRLDDYTEDVRVELEIRISDEEVLGRGYEALLLLLPGALPSPVPSPSDGFNPETGGGGGEISGGETLAEVEAQIQAFINGTDPTIERALKSFTKKLEDVEHDIMVVKRVLHDPSPSPSPASPAQNTNPSTNTTGGGGGSWTSWIRTPTISRPTTPTTPSTTDPTPTFGNIMTNRNKSSILRRTTSSTFGLSLAVHPGTDVVKSLGMRIPMPDFAFALTMNSSSSSSFLRDEDHLGFGLGFGFGGVGIGTSRSRTISSSMYLLGMGMSSAAAGRGGGGGRRSPVGVGEPVQRPVGGLGSGVVGAGAPGSAAREGEEDVD